MKQAMLLREVNTQSYWSKMGHQVSPAAVWGFVVAATFGQAAINNHSAIAHCLETLCRQAGTGSTARGGQGWPEPVAALPASRSLCRFLPLRTFKLPAQLILIVWQFTTIARLPLRAAEPWDLLCSAARLAGHCLT